MTAPNVFISYRRSDSEWAVDRLFDELEKRLGKGRVFRDLDRIQPGMNFRQVILAEVEKCDICVVIVGSNWIDVRDEDGNRRLDSEHDYVRTEILAAQYRKIPIVPVLLGATRMPSQASLPRKLQFLSELHAATIRPARDFGGDVADLAAVLLDIPRTKTLERPAELFDGSDFDLVSDDVLDDELLADSGSEVIRLDDLEEEPLSDIPQFTAEFDADVEKTEPERSPPRRARGQRQSQNQGLIIALVFFVLVTVGLAVATFMLYQEVEALKGQQRSAASDAPSGTAR